MRNFVAFLQELSVNPDVRPKYREPLEATNFLFYRRSWDPTASQVMVDRRTGQSHGFVAMQNRKDASAAVEALDG